MSEILNVLARFAACGVHPVVEGGELFLDAAAAPPADIVALCRHHRAALLAHLAAPPPRVFVDFETASRCNLQHAGALAYAEHPTTRPLLLSYAVGGGPVQVWLPSQPVPEELRAALEVGGHVVAHNAPFDRAIYTKHLQPLGWPAIAPERWSDTSTRARLARLPGGLAGAAKALGLEQVKDQAGKGHMLGLAKAAYVGGSTPTPAELDRLAAYAVQDIVVLREIDRQVPELSPDDAEVAEMDHAMNLRGMPVDLVAVRKLIVLRDQEDVRLLAELNKLTEGEVTTAHQIERMRGFLAKHGVRLDNLQSETLEQWLTLFPNHPGPAAKVIRIRLALAQSATNKLDAIVAAAEGTGRVRDGFVHFGAHTGRWSGRGVQLQNLPRSGPDTEAVLKRLTSQNPLRAGAAPGGPGIKELIGSVLRGLFVAPKGETFAVADLSQIESRVLCWLAGQEDKLELYRAGEDVYLPTAQALGSNSRDLGKLLVLSAGFGASGDVLLRKAPQYKVTLSAAEAFDYIGRWRADNPSITLFWNTLFDAFKHVIEAPLSAPPISVNDKLTVWRDAQAVRIRLPSGREMIYRNPRMVPKPSSDYGADIDVDLPLGAAMQKKTIWRGLLAENVTQAVARDILVDGMLRLHRAGVSLIASVHDEIVALTSSGKSQALLRNMLEVLGTPPAWAEGLPLAAEGYVNTRFVKPKKVQAPKPVAEFPPAEPRSWKTDPALRPTPKRDGPDFWPTPPCLVAALVHDVLPHLPAGVIWEPAAGSFVLVDALRRAGRTVVASDIDTGQDFLSCPLPSGAGLIITNPPFNLHSAFIDRALELMGSGEVDAVVQLFRHDHTQQESQQPPHCRLDALRRATIDFTCPWRPRWIAGSTGNGRWTFHWIVWIRDAPRQPPEIVTRRNPDGSFAKTKGGKSDGRD